LGRLWAKAILGTWSAQDVLSSSESKLEIIDNYSVAGYCTVIEDDSRQTGDGDDLAVSTVID